MKTMKLLLGGSPCTHWSIAQTKNRETKPEGLGWELFRNYLIALEKFKQDFFLYENNKSMAPAIRAQITRELGVEPILINSALVSAQNRQRLYWTNIPGVEQPEDRGILLRDILESGVVWREKGYTLKTNYINAGAVNGVDGGHFPVPMAAERLRGVQIENRPAVDLIRRFNYPNVLIYADPPYMLGTRRNRKQYRHEMTDDDHVELLEALKAHKGPAIISGYDSDLYNTELRGWHKDGRTSFTQTASRRKEIIWMNFEPAEQMDIFREE